MIKDLNFQALYQCAIILYDDLLDYEVISFSLFQEKKLSFTN